MSVPDTNITTWYNDYAIGLDRNTPKINDPGGGNLDDEFRNIKSVARAESLNGQFERWNLTPTRTAANVFTVDGDQSGVAVYGREVRGIHSGHPDYFGIVASAVVAAGVTTVTCVAVANALQTDLTEIQWGTLISSDFGQWQTGLPHYHRSGTVSLTGPNPAVANPTVQVPLGANGVDEPLPYFVQATASGRSGAITSDALKISCHNFTTTSFQMTVGPGVAALPTGASVNIDWVLFRL